MLFLTPAGCGKEEPCAQLDPTIAGARSHHQAFAPVLTRLRFFTHRCQLLPVNPLNDHKSILPLIHPDAADLPAVRLTRPDFSLTFELSKTESAHLQ